MDAEIDRPYRIAIVGAGPAGFYTAGALLDRYPDGVTIDIIERLLAPYGLVRYGVAPDHPKIKSVARVYEKVASHPAVRVIGNVTVGRDLTVENLRRFYDAIVYAVGAQTDRTLGIPGEELAGCVSSSAFVSWYNGHPDYADFSLSLEHERVAVVGIGNVAIDVARILARSPDELATTDIADPALDRLRTGRVREIHVLARRGPAQARCTPAELGELGAIEGVEVRVDPRDLELGPGDEAALAGERNVARNLDILRGFAGGGDAARRIHFHFYTSPIEALGDGGRVRALRLARNTVRHGPDGSTELVPSGETETLEVTLVVTAIGYRSVPIEGVPFDEREGRVPNALGRVVDPTSGVPVPREYVVGWAKRGPRGLIGSNKADAAETVAEIAEDLSRVGRNPDMHAGLPAVLEHLTARGVRVTTFEHWQLLDRLEIAKGREQGRPRVKFVRTEEMIERLDETDDES